MFRAPAFNILGAATGPSRLTAIEITNYRGYRGTFRLDLPKGENLIIFGENGSGKSSFYNSLRTFFEAPDLKVKITETVVTKSRPILILDGGTSFGLAIWLLLIGNRDRRTLVRSELQRIAELNHEVRNALQVLVSSHFDADPEHRQMVVDSVNRINSVLKRLFPVVGGESPQPNRRCVAEE